MSPNLLGNRVTYKNAASLGTVLAFDASRRKKGGEERREEGEREDSLWQAPTKIGFVSCNTRFL